MNVMKHFFYYLRDTNKLYCKKKNSPSSHPHLLRQQLYLAYIYFFLFQMLETFRIFFLLAGFEE